MEKKKCAHSRGGKGESASRKLRRKHTGLHIETWKKWAAWVLWGKGTMWSPIYREWKSARPRCYCAHHGPCAILYILSIYTTPCVEMWPQYDPNGGLGAETPVPLVRKWRGDFRRDPSLHTSQRNTFSTSLCPLLGKWEHAHICCCSALIIIIIHSTVIRPEFCREKNIPHQIPNNPQWWNSKKHNECLVEKKPRAVYLYQLYL